MNSSHKFDLFQQQLTESKLSTEKQPEQSSFHLSPRIEKKLCIIWNTGQKKFFLYSHLITVELECLDDISIVIIQFIGECLTLKGYNLSVLFDRFLNDEPYFIIVTNPRYVTNIPPDEFIVTDALIEKS
jgi:hypothetical protein